MLIEPIQDQGEEATITLPSTITIQTVLPDADSWLQLQSAIQIIEQGLNIEPQSNSISILHQPSETVTELITNLGQSSPHSLTTTTHIIILSAANLAPDPAHYIDAIRNIHLDKFLPIILVGQPQDSNVFIDAMHGGANDYILLDTPPELVAVKLQAQIRARNIQAVIEEQHDAIRENHSHILREQQMAKEVFDKVAHDLVDLANVKYWLSPIAVFNGDVLLATPTPSGGLLVLMGDFTGHGLGAAIGAIPLASTFYGMTQKGFAIHDIVRELNAKLYEILPTGVFCCACVAQLDFSSGVAEIWNAGLPDCYILRESGCGIEPISSTALALGILSSQAFNFESKRYNLKAKDRLYLLSDGLLETENEAGEQYGAERLEQALVEGCNVGGKHCFDSVKGNVLEYIGNHARADDISFVEIEAVAEEDFAKYTQQSNTLASQAPVSWCFTYEFRADSLQHQDPVPLILHTLLEEPNLRRNSGRLFSIVSELYNNALDHGLLELDSRLKRETQSFEKYYNMRAKRLSELSKGSVTFKLEYEASEEQGILIVDVIDTGKGFDVDLLPDNGQQPALHGRGLALIRSICERVEFLGCGNHVQVEYRW